MSDSSDKPKKASAASHVSLGVTATFARQMERMQKSAAAFSYHYEKQMSAIPNLSQQLIGMPATAGLSRQIIDIPASARLSEKLLGSSALAKMSEQFLGSSATTRLSEQVFGSSAASLLSQQHFESPIYAGLSPKIIASTWELPDSLSDSMAFTNARLNEMINRYYGQGLMPSMLQQAIEIADDICRDDVEDDELTEQARSANDEFQALANGSLDLESLSDKSLRFLIWLLTGFVKPIFIAAMGGIIAYQYIDYKTSALESAKTHREAKALARCYSDEEKVALSGCRVVLGDGLHIRGTPGIKGSVIASLPVGKIVIVLDSSERSWLLIEADVDGETVEGWISRRYTAPFR